MSIAPTPREVPVATRLPNVTFDGLLLDCGGAGLLAGVAAAGLGRRIEALSRSGVEIAVVSAVDAVAVDRLLAIHQLGPGRLHLCAGDGREVVRVAGNELTSVWQGGPDPRRADGVRWVMADWWDRGIGSGLVGVAADPSEGLRAAAGPRATFVAVDGEPIRLVELLDDQLVRRRQRRVPAVDQDSAWTLILDDRSLSLTGRSGLAADGGQRASRHPG